MDGLSSLVGNAVSYTKGAVSSAATGAGDLLFGASSQPTNDNDSNENSTSIQSGRRASVGAFGGAGVFDARRRHSAQDQGEGFFDWGGDTGSRRDSAALEQAQSGDIFATAEKMRQDQINAGITGRGYNLSFVHHKNPSSRERPYFFASPTGAPFPSYHSNPMPNFPSRWTQISDSHNPCENLTAPRIRLAPKELTHEKRDELERMRYTAGSQDQLAEFESLNLAFQCLGDPYQYEAFVTFMDLNRNVKILNLNDNELEDINDLFLDTVVRLHLSRNNFCSFEAIPDLPNCQELFLTENFLAGFNGIRRGQFPILRVLNVNRTPIAMLPSYRQKLKDKIPSLEYVDGLRV